MTRVTPQGSQNWRLGFVQLCDAAPLIMAAELGYFREEGLFVELSREMGWATLLDKIVQGELTAAHALGPLPLAASIGLGSFATVCQGLMVLNTHGNAITISRKLVDEGVKTSEDFATYVRQNRWERRFVLGSVSPFSTHHYLLRRWLSQIGLTPGKQVDVVTLPPRQFLRHLESGTVIGACVGEPWNSMAVSLGLGAIMALSREIEPNHPEKVLMARRDTIDANPQEVEALLVALIRAANWCDDPANADQLAQTLSRRVYLDMPAPAIKASLQGTFSRGVEGLEAPGPMFQFGGPKVQEITLPKARWLQRCLVQSGQMESSRQLSDEQLRSIYAPALYKKAQVRLDRSERQIS
ncbi:MAG: CmpA/NrtA family ABC transporter substrate-binding protein [Verrucomicrobiota bacterium JB022]|nr:CmpA/NrtA family ABC transporter substrate-binding protein [Verrucomicrobiota bacterium JB022]